MGMFTLIKAGWKSQTKAEKIKCVVNLVCSLGGGIVGNKVRDICAPTATNKLEKTALFLTSWGVGGAIGDAAGHYFGEAIDACFQLNDIRKNLKQGQSATDEENDDEEDGENG